jgi:hypothetical protein
MTAYRASFDAPSSLAKLISTAERNSWCTQPLCTTCGSHDFRNALQEIPKDEVISGLRSLPTEFFYKHADMFRLIIQEISLFGVGGELLDPLEGTPAGDQLRSNIEYQKRKYDSRKAYLATQTPEAIARRRAQKKADKENATAPHRERKAASETEIRTIQAELNSMPVEHILQFVETRNFNVSLQVIGGLIYKRLRDYYKTTSIPRDDLGVLSLLADRHSGHWRKLFDQVTQGKVI